MLLLVVIELIALVAFLDLSQQHDSILLNFPVVGPGRVVNRIQRW